MRVRRIGLAPVAPNAALQALVDGTDPLRPIVLHMTPDAYRALNMRRLVRADMNPFPRFHLWRWWR